VRHEEYVGRLVHRLELRIPPLLLFAIWGAAMTGIAYSYPSLVVSFPGLSILGAVIAAAGGALAVTGIVAFRRQRTTVNPLSPESAAVVVSNGAYRISRNPMYVGLVAVLVGWALHLAHPLSLLLTPFFVMYMTRFQIIPEERALIVKFGDVYWTYMETTPRWI